MCASQGITRIHVLGESVYQMHPRQKKSVAKRGNHRGPTGSINNRRAIGVAAENLDSFGLQDWFVEAHSLPNVTDNGRQLPNEIPDGFDLAGRTEIADLKDTRSFGSRFAIG